MRRPSAVVRQRRSRGELGVRHGRGDPRRLEQRLTVGGLAALELRLPQPDQRLTTLGAVEVADQLDGVCEQFHGLGRREALKRALTGPEGVVGRLGLVDRDCGDAPVKRELCQVLARVLAVEILERLGNTLVHARAAGGAEALIQRLVDQRMGEAKVSRQSAELALVPLNEAVQHPFRRVLDKLRADLDPRLIRHRQLFRASAPADGEAPAWARWAP